MAAGTPRLRRAGGHRNGEEAAPSGGYGALPSHAPRTPLTIVVVADFLLAAALTVRHRAAAPGTSRGRGRREREAEARSSRHRGRREGAGGGGRERAGTREAGPRGELGERAAPNPPQAGEVAGRGSGQRACS